MHVPLYSDKDEFKLFEYEKTPFIVPNNETNMAMRLEGEHELIALCKDETRHQVFSWADIDRCKAARPVQNGLILCPNANVIQRRDDNSCIVGLFKRNNKVIREHCRWKAAKRESYSLQINANQFSTFVPEPTELRIECKNGSLTTEKTMEIDGHLLITIQGLCKGYIGR